MASSCPPLPLAIPGSSGPRNGRRCPAHRCGVSRDLARPRVSRPQDDDCRRKGCGGLPAAESQPAPQEPDLVLHHVTVPPPRVGPGRNQGDHGGPFVLGGVVRPGDPSPDRGALRWIHPHDLVGPGLEQAVLATGEVPRAPGVFVSRARVKSEPEFAVQSLEQPRKAAFHSGAPKQGPGLGSSLRNL